MIIYLKLKMEKIYKIKKKILFVFIFFLINSNRKTISDTRNSNYDILEEKMKNLIFV